jgi:hypothetical protein
MSSTRPTPRLRVTPTPRPPLVRWLSRLRPASDMDSRTGVCARPAFLTGYSPDNAGQMPLIDFCSWNDSRAQPRTIRPLHIIVMASHHVVSCTALARRYRPNVAFQGSRPLVVREPTPTRRPHAVRGFTLVCSIRTPPVIPPYPLSQETGCAGDRADAASLRERWDLRPSGRSPSVR